MGQIGDSLRERRVGAGVDVQEVEEATKIRAKYLRALENEEFDLLPGPTYVKSFLRTYADELGLDGRYLVDVYRRDYERGEISDLPIVPIRPAGRDRRPRWGRIVLVLLVLAVLVIVALVVVGLLSGDSASATNLAA